MKSNVRWLFCLLLLGFAAHAAPADKVRLFVLTDIENEPDDAQSLRVIVNVTP